MNQTGRKTIKGGKVTAPMSVKASKSKVTMVAAKSEPTHEEIAARAYEIFLSRGGEPGHHEEDWLMAESQLRA
jgi:hypothetical protein